MSRGGEWLRWVSHTRWPVYLTAVGQSNIVAVIALWIFLAVILPVSTTGGSDFLNPRTWTLLAVYSVLALVFGAFATTALVIPVLRWHRHPDSDWDPERIRRRVLRIPVRQALLNLGVWFGALLIFVLSAVWKNPQQVAIVSVTTIIFALTTALMVYLQAERILRPISALALQRASLNHPVEPPIYWRLVQTWLLTSGIPVLGIGCLTLAYQQGLFSQESDVVLLAVGLFAAATFITGLFGSMLVSTSVVDPLRELQGAINKVRAGESHAQVRIYDGSEIGVLQAGFNDMIRDVEQRQKLRDLFGRYVGSEVAKKALESSPTLGGEERYVGVLFVDLTGSTTYGVDHTPEEVVEMLNRFFRCVVDVVHRHHGIINKFQGDAALAIFGAPIATDNPATDALAAAREMRTALKNTLELECGIGVHAGQVIAGHLGTAARFEYTVIGDAVNLAARLTELAKKTPGGVLTTAATVAQAETAEAHRWTQIRSVELRGRGELTQLARPIRPTLADRHA